MKIRFATLDDAEPLFHLLLGLHKEQGAVPLSPVKADTEIRWAIENADVLVAEVDGELVGSICIVQRTIWYSEATVMVDQWIYVRPEFRSSGVGKKLVDAAKIIAHDAGQRLALEIASPQRLKAKIRLYRKWGFYLLGAVMLEGR